MNKLLTITCVVVLINQGVDLSYRLQREYRGYVRMTEAQATLQKAHFEFVRNVDLAAQDGTEPPQWVPPLGPWLHDDPTPRSFCTEHVATIVKAGKAPPAELEPYKNAYNLCRQAGYIF